MEGRNGSGGPPPCAKGEEGRPGTWVMGTPVAPSDRQGSPWIAVDYSPSGTSAASRGPPAPAGGGFQQGRGFDTGNPYVQVSSAPGSQSSMDTVLKVLGRCGKKLEDTTRKAGGVAGNVWHHLKTSPNLTDAAMTKLAQRTKVLAEGGHDKVFHQIFNTLPGEQLRKSYACYLSTSVGPVIGTLYLSTVRLAFCSDNPLCHTTTNGQQQWAYYKVVVPLDQLMAVIPSSSMFNPADKYIQITTVDGHDFWFMGFVSYDKALKNLSEALPQFHAELSYPIS